MSLDCARAARDRQLLCAGHVIRSGAGACSCPTSGGLCPCCDFVSARLRQDMTEAVLVDSWGLVLVVAVEWSRLDSDPEPAGFVWML